MTVNYCQAGGRFPQRFKVAVNVEGEGNRDGVIELIGCGAFPEKGTESARTG